MIFEEKTISSELVYEGPVFKVRKHRVETRGGESVRDIVEHSGGSIMVAVTDEGKVLMVRQYRKAFEKALLELPAGKRDPGEVPEVTAARELREETGYTASSVKPLVSFYPTCGYSNEDLYEKAAYYLKHDSERVRIAQSGRAFVETYCSYNNRLEEMLKILKK